MKKAITILWAIIIVFTTGALQKAKAQNWLTASNTLTGTEKLGSLNNMPVKLYANNQERLRILPNTTGSIAGFYGGNSMWLGLYENGIYRGYFGSYAGAASDVDFGTGAGNLTGRLHLTTGAIPRFTIDSVGNAKFGKDAGASTFFQFGTSAWLKYDKTQYIWRHSNSQEGMAYNDAVGKKRIEYRDQLGVPNMWLEWNSTGRSYFRGNMGIGTEVPVRKLQVQEGDIRIQKSTSQARYLEFVDPASCVNDFRFEHGSANGGRFYISTSRDNFVSYRDIAYFNDSISCTTPQPYVFTVLGRARASAWNITSDEKLKTNVAGVDNAMAIVKELKPHTYSFKTKEYGYLNLPSEKQYGFLAQEIEKVLPSLVQTEKQPVRINEKGEKESEDIKSVNYTAIIPILTKALQQQQQEIDELKEKVNYLLQKGYSGTSGNVFAERKAGTDAAMLEQNQPNPFNQSTIIRYSIPKQAGKAFIKVTSSAGVEIKTIALGVKEKNLITLQAGELAAGTYFYSLVIDGKISDSKSMVILK